MAMQLYYSLYYKQHSLEGLTIMNIVYISLDVDSIVLNMPLLPNIYGTGAVYETIDCESSCQWDFHVTVYSDVKSFTL